MPVPVTWDDIFTNPAENSPQGSEPLGTQADDYIRQAFAFCKQLHDGWIAADGSVALTADLDAATHTVKNLAAPANPNDAATKGYADGLITANFPHGAIIMWAGNLASIPKGWILCDGTNGTPNLVNRMPFGINADAGLLQLGGNNSISLAVANLPSHGHGVIDNGHGHNIGDNGHSHGVIDNQHSHGIPVSGGPAAPGFSYPGTSNGNYVASQASGSNIGIQASGTGVWVQAAAANIGIQATGGGQAFDIRSAYCGVYFIMKT